MGKRRDRRLANQSNAGRRVKLDLSAEPPGDSGDPSAVNEELGEDFDPTQLKSPSSSDLRRFRLEFFPSGPEPQNPLLLLGQYSDDELDGGQGDELDHASRGNCTTDVTNEESPLDEVEAVKEEVADSSDDLDGKIIAQQHNSTEINGSENFEANKDDQVSFLDSVIETPAVENTISVGYSNGQIVTGWNMVLHGESNQYYYWNTETGETSWEVPFCLTEGQGLAIGEKNSDTENVEDDLREPCVKSVGIGQHYLHDIDDFDKRENDSKLQVSGIAVEELQHSVNQSESQMGTNSDVVVPDNNISFENNMIVVGSHNAEHEFSSLLISQCESLLEKVKPLRRCCDCVESKDNWTSTCLIELQVRLSDMRSLRNCGSSLLPFWNYTEKQLKKLENSLNQKIYDLAVLEQLNDADDGHADIITNHCDTEPDNSLFSSHYEEDKIEKGVHKDQSLIRSGDLSGIHQDDTVKQVDVNIRQVLSVSSPATHREKSSETSLQVPDNPETRIELHSLEDVDMDIDMEVEDTFPGPSTVFENGSYNNRILTTEPSINLTSTESLPLPPPEDEWIPPPPPDNEELPPLPPYEEHVPQPPPDEPVVSCYDVSLTSHVIASQVAPHYENAYNISFTDPAYQGYENVIAIPTDCLYVHSGVGQVVGLDTSIYYGAITPSFGDTVSNQIPSQPVAYFHIQNGSVSPVHVEATASMHAALSSSYVVDGNNSSLKGPDGGVVLKDPPSVSSPSKDVHLVNESVDDDRSIVNDSSTVAASVTSAAEVARVKTASGSSKAVRSKKRALAVVSSTRLNKKVSSMVDKWKAAKEELHSDEEHENAFELLEKKRQREIEDWKAKQIASGEAKDNANFQPLGGDWRDRVKRKRAASARVSTESHIASDPHTVEDHTPNLTKLSKDLPNGWQVYWDEASKQVYYGNAKTRETSWSRPSK